MYALLYIKISNAVVLCKSIQIDENFADAYAGRAWIYQTQGKNESAEENFKTAGDKYYYSENYTAALSSFDAAVNINGNAINYTNRGWANYYLQKYDDAEKDFNKAIQIDEKYANAYRGRAGIYETQQKTKEAIANYAKAGVVNYNLKEYDEAKIDFDKAIELDANCEEARFYLALMAQDIEKNPHIAIAKYTELLESSSSYKPEIVYTNRGSMYCEIGEYENAINDFSKAIKLNPNYISAYAKRADVYNEKLNDYGNAFVDYKELLEIDNLKKELTKEQREEYEKKAQICWNALDSVGKIFLTIRHPGATGKINGFLKVFVIVMMVDFILSIAYASKSRNLTAGFALQKFSQKAIFLAIVMVMNEIDEAQLIDLKLRNPTIFLFLLYELLSILDNAGNLGVPIPDDLKNLVKTIIEKIRGIF